MLALIYCFVVGCQEKGGKEDANEDGDEREGGDSSAPATVAPKGIRESEEDQVQDAVDEAGVDSNEEQLRICQYVC